MTASPRRIAGWSLLLPLVPLLLAQLVFVPTYRTNDDIGMNMLAAGVGFTATPTPQLIFSHRLLGGLLNLAYASLPGAPWYWLFGLTAQYAAGVVVAHVTLQRQFGLTRLVLVLSYCLTFGLLFEVQRHFTISAAACALAGFLLWRDRAAHGERLGRAALAMFLALWTVSALIRYQSSVLILLLAAPSFLVHAARAAAAGSRWRALASTILLPLLGGGLLVAALTGYDRLQYARDATWHDFNVTAAPLGALVDFGRGAVAPREHHALDAQGNATLIERRYSPEAYRIAHETAGWSANDYDMLMEYFYADPELYGAEKLRRVLAALPRSAAREPSALAELRADRHLPLLLAVTLLACVLVEPRATRFIEIGLTVLAVAVVSSYLVLELDRFPSWVYQPILAFACCHAMVMAGRRPALRSWSDPRAWAAIVTLGATIGLLPATWSELRRDAGPARAKHRGLLSAMQRLRPTADQLHVVWGTQFPFESILPAGDLSMFRDFNIYSVGADTRGPFNRRQLERFGIDDIHRAVYDHPGVRVISDDRLNRLLVRYVAEHHGQRVVPVKTGEFRAGEIRLFSVYRFERRDTAAGPTL